MCNIIFPVVKRKKSVQELVDNNFSANYYLTVKIYSLKSNIINQCSFVFSQQLAHICSTFFQNNIKSKEPLHFVSKKRDQEP